MAFNTKTYNPANVLVMVGPNRMTNFAKGSFITVEFDEDHWTETVGADGEVTRSRNPSKTATVKLRLQGSSDSNGILSGLALADEASNAGIFPFLLKDGVLGDIIEGAETWIKKRPSREFDAEVSPNEWTLKIAKCNMALVGN